MSDIRNSKMSPLELGKSITIGKLRRSRVRFCSLLTQYRQAVAQLQANRPGTNVTVDAYGHPRVISNFSQGGLEQVVLSGSSNEHSFIEEFVGGYLDQKLTEEVLDSANVSLSLVTITELPNVAGWIVAFQETVESLPAEAEGRRSRCNVDKSRVEVLVRKAGDTTYEICRLTSSLSRVVSREAVEFTVSESQALAIAEKAMRRKLGQYTAKVISSKCEIQANPYRGQLVPIYRFSLCLEVGEQPLSVEVIVTGGSGKVVFAKPQGLHVQANTEVAGKALLNVPNRYKTIAEQMKDVMIDTSILRKVDGKFILANKYIEVHSCKLDENGRRSTQVVTTMPDDGTLNGGTFNWPENTPQAKAVVVYVAYMFLINLAIECGLRIPDGTKPLLVNAGDPWNVNNDTFYPVEQLIQDGVGDGNFMRKDMVYDLVPDDHELVHWFVYLLRPSDHYIQGNLGGALNEAIADIVATLVRYLSWLLFGAKLGDELTYDKLMHDMAVIGYYCFVASADGFRVDNNNSVYPDDLHGTNVHDNARIPAAAMLHTDFAMVDNAVGALQAAQPMSNDQALQFVLPTAIKDFLRMIITAIPLLPAHDVTFSDWRKALEDSDNLIFRGSHRGFIAKGFDRHKIKTNTVVLSRLADFGRR